MTTKHEIRTKKQWLEAKVRLHNQAAAEAEKVCLQLREIFTPFVGTRVARGDGGLWKTHERLVRKIPNRPEYQVRPIVCGDRSKWCWALTLREFQENGTFVFGRALMHIGYVCSPASGLRNNIKVLIKVATENPVFAPVSLKALRAQYGVYVEVCSKVERAKKALVNASTKAEELWYGFDQFRWGFDKLSNSYTHI